MLRLVAFVIVQTEDIQKIGRATNKKKAYEVKRFELTEENWKNRIIATRN